MQNINLVLTVEETNLVLQALSNMPFGQVQALVANIQKQGSEQVAQKEEAKTKK